MNGITSSGAKGINALGPRYMGKYHPLMEIGPRDLLIQGTHRELTEGNGPPFALDLPHIDRDILHHLQYDSMPGDKETWNDYCALCSMAAVWLMVFLKPGLAPRLPKSPLNERMASLKTGLPIMGIFFLVIGGIYGGMFTATEGGAIGAFGTLLLICVPIFVPIAKVFGWDLIWFGVIITVLDNMASITPPFGISLFVMKEVAGVTLGAMSPAGMHHSAETPARRHPKVGSDVTIYAGATLLGGATEVGDNVVIGGNAFLTESVESDTKVSIKKPEMTFRVKGGRF